MSKTTGDDPLMAALLAALVAARDEFTQAGKDATNAIWKQWAIGCAKDCSVAIDAATAVGVRAP